MKPVAIIVSFLFLAGTMLNAQNTIAASGGNAAGAGGSVSFTVGQIVYTTIVAGNGSVAHGVQQPYEISVITGIEKAKDIILEILIYPNPASDIIILKTGDYEGSNLSYRLYDLNGILLLTGKTDDDLTTIGVGQLKPAVYLLSIMEGNMTVKTFRIIKK